MRERDLNRLLASRWGNEIIEYEEKAQPIRELAEAKGREDALAGKKQNTRIPKQYADFQIAYAKAYFLGYSIVINER